MTAGGARYLEAKRLFIEALALPLEQRAGYVELGADGDAALAAEVMQMLKAELTKIDVPEPGVSPHDIRTSVPGYRILSELGRGGMGVVYLAERTADGVVQKLAIKRMLPGFPGTSQDIARFHGERQILATLDHPHIARLVDAGTTTDGSPYFAMEYIEGERIDRYVRKHRLDIRQRMQLIAKVARAVDSAHRHLVVHRDLKPGNILVDAYGEPKLLDFGIAKLLDASTIERHHSATTVGGVQMLTPLYAAPEQVRCEAISTATDVYALGVVIYELLTGLSPYGRSATSSPHFLSHAICEEDPTAPSAAVASSEVDVRFALAPGQLRGDLDAIVLKCLRKQPEARYASMDALVADLEAWATDQPVDARRGSRWYHLQRFARRHWVALGASALIVLLTVAFVIGLGRELNATQVERDRAEAERERAQQVTSFMVKLFSDADPKQAKGESFTVRQALDRGYARVSDAELAEFPATRSHLLREFALIYSRLGDKETSLAAAKQAIALAEPSRQSAPLDFARAQFAAAVAHYERDELEDAARLLSQVLEAADAAGNVILATAALHVQGKVEHGRGNDAKAAQLYLSIEQRLLAKLGQSRLADAVNMPATGDDRELLDSLARSLSSRCTTMRVLAKPREALALCESAVALGNRVWSPSDPAHIPISIELAILHQELGNTEFSLATNREVIRMARRIYGDRHVRVAFPMVNLALDLGELKRKDEALKLMAEAVGIFKEQLGVAHRWYQEALLNQADLMRRSGETVAAIAAYQETLALQREGRSKGSGGMVAITLEGLALAQADAGQKDLAVSSARMALEEYTNVEGDRHPSTIQARIGLAKHLRENAEPAAALAEAERALADIAADEEDAELRATAQFALAQALRAAGQDPARAQELASSALASERKRDPKSAGIVEIEKWLVERR